VESCSWLFGQQPGVNGIGHQLITGDVRMEMIAGAEVGVEVALPRGATVIQTGFLDLAAIDQLRAVGDISIRYFDLEGKRVTGDVDERLMGLSWEDLRQLQNVVAVACGLDKPRRSSRRCASARSIALSPTIRRP
jgi:hypothetical protein